MALKDLISEIRGEEREKFEYFFSIVIGKTWVTSGIWRIVKDRAQVVAQGTPSSWQGNTQDLVKAADDSLSSAVAQLEAEGEEPKKVVFGLPPSWVEEGGIKREELSRLKVLSEKLELKPSGFVVIPEAIIHWLKSQEGTPLSAILVGLAEEEIDVTLVRTGQVAGVNMVARSVSLADDVTEGLVRFKEKQDSAFPSRILIYNHKEAELSEAKQALLSSDWKGLSFLHTPKIESLNPEATLFAVSFAGATEVGKATAIEGAFGVAEEEPQEAPEEEEQEEVEETPEAPEQPEQPEQVATLGAEELGFSEEDVKDIPQEEPEVEPAPQPQPEPEPMVQEREEEFLPKRGLSQALGIFSSLSAFFEQLFGQLSSLAGKRGVVAAASFLLFLLVLLGGLAYWRLPRAEVTIFVAPQKIERDLTFTVDPTIEALNTQEKEVPGRILETTVSGEKTRQTTGTKTVGERAKGQVKFINTTGGSVTVNEGATLTGPGGLKFSLDSDVAVASGSASSPGEGTGGVTADDIGAEYNLAAGSSFSVAGYGPSFEAENEDAFSGGSSREVAAVSKEDQGALEESLEEELIDKAEKELAAGLSGEQTLIAESASTSVELRSFSHEVGDEVDTLKLNLRLGISFLAVSKKDVASLVLEEMKEDVPEGFVLKEEQIESRFEFKEETRGRFVFEVFASANLLPQINLEELAAAIAGRYPPVAKEYLSSLPGYTRSTVKLKPNLPGKLGTLPRLPQNIQIEITAER